MDYFISQENCNSPWQGRSLEIFSVHSGNHNTLCMTEYGAQFHDFLTRCFEHLMRQLVHDALQYSTEAKGGQRVEV